MSQRIMPKPKDHFSIEKLPEFDDHELVTSFYDRKTGLLGFIAIHNTNLGPAVGGTRYWHYATHEDALCDVLRLSKAMTYKCALANAPYGGGKGVIIKIPRKQKNFDFWRSYAKRLNLLNGRFYTGEDVGIDERDIEMLSEVSSSIIGRPKIGGDPSPWAALGVFYAAQAALEVVYGTSEIRGRSFAIKGLGKVGSALCGLLYEAGADIIVADQNIRVLRTINQRFPRIKVVKSSEIHKQSVDVYAPCALGNEISNRKVAQLRCKIICGAANNQLATPKDGEMLFRRGILYVPDYIANAGGLINVVDELDKRGYSRKRVRQKIKGIKPMVSNIIQLSSRLKKPTDRVADQLAESIFKKNGK